MTETRLHYDKDVGAGSAVGAMSSVKRRFMANYDDTPLEIVTMNAIKLAPGKWRVNIRAENDPDYPES